MKKLFISAFLIVLSALLVLSGCGKKTENEPQDTPLSGGWTVNQNFGAPDIPSDAKAAFDKAVKNGEYTPVAYLGSQIVAGINYAFLCTDKSGALNTIKIYNDLSGNASILDTEAVNIADYTQDAEPNYEQLSGGFTYNSAVGAPIGDDVKAAFDKATADLTGVSYEPLACLGTQVVAGTNYAVLCKSTPASANSNSALTVVIIYSDLQQNTSVTSVCAFAP